MWYDIKGLEGICQINLDGQVKTLARITKSSCGNDKNLRERILKSSLNSNGYRFNMVRIKNRCFRINIHRALAEIFIPNPDNKPFINHKNGIRSDNRIENLEWCTAKENTVHSRIVLGQCIGERNGRAKLTEQNVLDIRKEYVPYKTPCRKLAEKYGVSRNMIMNVLSKRNWKCV